MVKLEKILCFIFTLFIVYLVNRHCVVEGIININSFDNCIDDPQWYTLDSDGQKHYCKDIGDTSSCYDMDPLQQEGWERCLKTCGNCADTTVSIAPMDNLAMYSGGNGEDFDRVDIDDSRKWLGVGVGDENNIDVRGTITRDEEDDIVNIFDRLETVEDLYDMLLGSISSCLDCSIYDNNECTQIDNCMVRGTECVTKESTTADSFISCNGNELRCNYTIKDIKDREDTNTQDSSTIDSTTENVNSTNKVRTYVKQNCESSGECSIVFPTYEFSCNNIPTTPYGPTPADERWCLTSSYYNDLGVSDIAEKMNVIDNEFSTLQTGDLRGSIEIRDVIEAKDALFTSINTGVYTSSELNTLSNSVLTLLSTYTEPEVLIKLNTINNHLVALQNDLDTDNLNNLVMYNNNITPLLSPQSHDCTNQSTGITNGIITVDGNTITIASDNNDRTAWLQDNIDKNIPLIEKPGASNPEYCMSSLTISNDTGFTLSSTDINILSNISPENADTLSITLASADGAIVKPITIDTASRLNIQPTNLLDSIATNCYVNKDVSVIGKCYKVNVSDDDDNQTKAKEACANYCNESNDKTNYISIVGDQCRCFIDLPLPTTVDKASPLPVGTDACTTGSELLDIGTNNRIQDTSASNQTDAIINNCKSYFLLEKTLTREDIDGDDEDRDDIISNIDNMSERISLYDVCPTQCNAVGCV